MTEQTVADEASQTEPTVAAAADPQADETAAPAQADEGAAPAQADEGAAEKAAKKPARRRAPRRDEVLAEAVLTARAGLAGLAEDGQIGEHRGATVDDDRLMTHRWDAKLPGYRGWQWYSTVARAPRSKHVTVCEVGLAAGEDSIVAPAWVPYADRVSEEERERMKAVAEGRDPNRAVDGRDADKAEKAEKDGRAGKAADEKADERTSGTAEAAPEADPALDAEATEQSEEAAVVVAEEAADAPAEQAADPDPAPETDSAPDAEAPEAEEAAEEPAQES